MIIAENHYLELRGVYVEIGDPIQSKGEIKVAPAPTGPIPTYLPGVLQYVNMSVQLSPEGTIKLRTGARTFDIVTRTSEPVGKWAMTKADRSFAIHPGKRGCAQWECKGYRVSRAVSVGADHIHVADTYTSTSAVLIGVMHEDSLVFDRKPIEVKLGGRPSYQDYQNDTGGAILQRSQCGTT